MIVGVGVDVVQISRFVESLDRTPALRTKLFTPAEGLLAPQSLAARFAAKEAIAKALGAPPGLGWHDAEVIKDESGRPRFVLAGTVLTVASGLGVTSTHLSLTHDGGIASAFVVLES